LNKYFFDCYKQQTVLLVEGVFDAWGFIKHGLPALCTFGKSISAEQINLLRSITPREVIFVWDIDAYKEMAQAVSRLQHVFPSLSVVDVEDERITTKVDPGDALVHPWVMPWFMEKLAARMDVNSPEFFQWRMKKM
jgi:hypothetical protein